MIGIDIIKIERIKKAAESEHFVKSVFSQKELDYAADKNNKGQTLAGIFAAKEAVLKALGTGISSLRLDEVEILHTESGSPYAVYSGEIFDVSISHDGEYAVAVAQRNPSQT